MSVSSITANLRHVSVYFLIRCWFTVRCRLALYWSPIDRIFVSNSSSLNGGLMELDSWSISLLTELGILSQLFIALMILAPFVCSSNQIVKIWIFGPSRPLLILTVQRTGPILRSPVAIIHQSFVVILLSLIFVVPLVSVMSPCLALFFFSLRVLGVFLVAFI